MFFLNISYLYTFNLVYQFVLYYYHLVYQSIICC